MKSSENECNSTVDSRDNSRGWSFGYRGRRITLRPCKGSSNNCEEREELNFHNEVLDCRVQREKRISLLFLVEGLWGDG